MSEWYMLAGISRLGLIFFPEITNFKICNTIIEGTLSYIIVLFICIFVKIG